MFSHPVSIAGYIAIVVSVFLLLNGIGVIFGAFLSMSENVVVFYVGAALAILSQPLIIGGVIARGVARIEHCLTTGDAANRR